MDPEAGTAPQATTEAPGDWPVPLDDPRVVGGGALSLLLILVFTLWAALGRGRAEPPLIAPPIELPAPIPAERGLVAQLREALGRTRAALQGQFDSVFARPIDDAMFEELETTLLTADVGVPTTQKLLGPLKEMARSGQKDPIVLRGALRDGMKKVLSAGNRGLEPVGKPWVILVVGVNGSGKTTTIGKLAAQLNKQGKKVLVAAGDTYRAAAIEQLTVWAERAEAQIVAHQEGADPGAVAYDALQAAIARGSDVVIIDTAGRLQTRKPLMDQLSKMRRVIDKVVPGAPHETLLVIDGTMGQNALSQAQLFHEATPLTGVVVTKLDGTAKGGMVLTLASELGLPVKLIGIGEKVDDLRPFDPDAFVDALA